MSKPRSIPLERIRTDGWFERLGESIGSFHTLCDVLGERFFAFALIAGARVNSLMIDRFNPDQSLVEFSFGGVEEQESNGDTERLAVVEFRQRLVAILLNKEAVGPKAKDVGDDLEALQKHIGPRSLLLAPLYGYGLKELIVDGDSSTLSVERGPATETFDVPTFRERLLDHVREDLERGVQRDGGTAIDLNNVAEAETAAADDDWDKVVQLLGSWPMPLAIYWRTPEGQLLAEEARQRIAEGLGLLGTACAKLGDPTQGEEVLRLAVQYAQDGSSAAAIFSRLGKMFLDDERWGESIAPLRRAHALGAPPADVLPDLATAFLERDRAVAALAFVLEAEAVGVETATLEPLRAELDKRLGKHLERWQKLVS
ncbi:MAG: hypothetical protein DRI90_21705 [Deltaproteobacteria bacterium]|nr:MAG: hypothetical protein DRI90_21705 [Deltaproteobacteria bacterium]